MRPVAESQGERPTALTDLGASPAAPTAPATPAEPISLEKLQRARARVIRVRRAETAATPAATETTKADTQTNSAKPAASGLSDEAEAALAAELAALAGTTPPSRPDQGAAINRLSPNGDEAVSRLMAEASTQMAGPETRRRQSAIAHLKAAVAATLAERRITGDKPREWLKVEQQQDRNAHQQRAGTRRPARA